MARGPTAVIETLLVFVGVFATQVAGPSIGLGAAAFALALPLETHPWTLVTSVYAHGSLSHLLANAIALVVVGVLAARRTTRIRFHLFILTTGAAAGVTTVFVGAATGGATAVLGASGAIFALVGYLLAGNLATEAIVGRVRLSRRGWTLVVSGLAVVVAVTTGGPGVALTAHVTGFLLGIVAGRLHLLRTA